MQLFHKTVNRRGTHSTKWDTYKNEELIHAWIADMDFEVPKPIQTALQKRIEHPIFGYTLPPENIGDIICNWTKSQYNWEIQKEWIVFSAGIVPALSTSIQAITKEGDAVLVQPPIYPPFFEMVKTNNRQLCASPLFKQNGIYKIDFEHLETQFKQGVKLMLLCSPHNPIGRVWTKEELIKLGTLCTQYNVTVVADEIHADIIYRGHNHTPFASLSEELAARTITCMAPSKTFNIAGLQASIIIIPNENLRNAFMSIQYRQGFHGLNTFAYTAMQSAYTECNDWLNEIRLYAEDNAQFACEYIQNHIPALSVVKPEGSFLLWIDCSHLDLSQDERTALLEEKGKIIVEPGEKYGTGGEAHIRINIGCPRSVLEEILNRLHHTFS
ncbi:MULTISPECIES: MalY/PatB family protein [Bacillus]|uniref:cysteine-S-conjugate beta-lyase n=2 Tax=Bacillus cereus group TaxID=86661 RepID=A0A2C1DJP6_BACCE|nr:MULTISPECIES: MalY/PatB family protein [Bacillus cereus group]OFD71002.1 cystathionine beta-lyase [Bacillus mycoides]OFD71673.1 cystathionine beta-lyase [Bacillus mycoides]OFD74626.1 cystathionine beta-lyase [Bacillus mycoides]PGS99909.1 pyridoxal phosphate-dependent aminotransferase [Bacillus cereus]